MNYYTPVLSETLDAEKVNALVQLYEPNVNRQSIFNLELDQTAAYFDTSDNIWTLSKDNYLGYLTNPTQIAGSQCRDGPPLKYLTNTNSSCITDSNKLSCKPGTKLGIDYYTNLLTNFKVIAVSYYH